MNMDFYSDKHTVFRVASQGAKSGHGMTQFGRALNELNIEILCANASQAKGRVERANRTLQDRLVKELRLPGKYVDSFEFPDGRHEFRWKRVSLPYAVFDKDQRVTHAAITENKRLSAVLEHIKAEQDKAPPKKRRAGKQRTKYTPTGRRNEGWNSLADQTRIADRKASQRCDN